MFYTGSAAVGHIHGRLGLSVFLLVCLGVNRDEKSKSWARPRNNYRTLGFEGRSPEIIYIYDKVAE